jgi:hypothetical protein
MGQVLFTENFDGLAGSLGDSVNERFGRSRVTRRVADAGTSVSWKGVNGLLTDAPAFSHTGPSGWTINNSYDAYGSSIGNSGVPMLGDPNYGVDEWEGWSFAKKDFWIFADDQTRSTFTKAVGTVAVADGDEWDDLRKDAAGVDIDRVGFMNTEMKTGNINVTAFRGTTMTFTFDSSWRPEGRDDTHGGPADPANNQNNQSVVVAANFDGGVPVNDTFLDFWDSVDPDPDPTINGFFKPDSQNETITRSISIPATATNMQLKFGYYNAANDWWWAVDNLKLTDAGNNTVWSEDFESVPLGPSVNERELNGHVTKVQTEPNTTPFNNAFTHTAPAGWNVNNTQGLPGIGNPNEGVEEWEGWSFVRPDFWLFVKDSNRSQFTKGTGLIAVADPDNWDALGDPEAIGTYNTLLETPAINITGVGAGLLKLAFDSSWRPEDTQTAIVEANYGNGWVQVLRWESDSNSPFFHDDNNTNESVLLSLANPAGATSVMFRWSLVNATDDWWWALDNISVSAVPEPSSAVMLATLGLSMFGFRRRSLGVNE